MSRYWNVALCWFAATVATTSVVAQTGERGRYFGEIVASFLPDGRNMMLAEPFSYVDPRGRHWNVPKGAITDGASIPQAFWTLYAPFSGKYREAAVIHDYYCQTRSASWKDTHNVFFDGLLTSGVDQRTATVMWAAVYGFGPRWGIGVANRGPAFRQFPSEDQQRKFMSEMEKWIAESKPSREEVARAMEDGRVPKRRLQ